MSEPTPGVMHPVDRAFYDLTVQQRNAAWREIERLRAEVERLRAEVALLSLHGSIALTARHATDCDTE